MDEVEELEPTSTNPHPAGRTAGSPTGVLEADDADLDDVTLAALLRQTARLRAIELQLAAVFDLRGHAESMRPSGGTGTAVTDCA
jgi:hypothetical protein